MEDYRFIHNEYAKCPYCGYENIDSWELLGDNDITACDNCGKDCEVPFKPSSGKPIYCSKCFEELAPKREDNRGSKDSRSPRRDSFPDRVSSKDYSSDISQLKDQLVGINKSLEKLVELFTPVKEEKAVKKVVKKKTESKKKATKSTKKAEKKK